MHGTFLNGSRINTHTLTELNDGDEVVFGAEVRRGIEIFPACAFRISYELGPYKATNSYAFPDTSENGDEEEVSFSDEESENEDLSSEDDDSVIAVGPGFSQSNHTIDLTREEPPKYSVHADNTGNLASASQIDHGHDIDSDDEMDKPASLDGIDYTHDDDLEAQAEERSEHYSSEDECALEASLCGDIEEGIVEEPQFEPLDNEDIDSSVYDYDSDMAASSSQEPPHVRLAEYPSSPTVIKGVERMVIPDDENNDFGLPKAAEEAMRVMVDNGLSNSRRPFYTFGPYHHPTISTTQLAANSPLIPDTYASVSQLSATPSIARPSYSNRQPSPSDAAMAKGPEMKDAEIPLSYIRSTANLGQGSGKEEFFKARELNKAILQNQEAWSSRFTEPYEAPVEKPAFLTRPIKACATKRMRAMAAASVVEAKIDGEAELKEPTLECSIAEVPTIFNELPAANSMTDLQLPSAPEPTAQPVRSGLRIDEIIERNSSDQEIVVPKRKAEDISTGVEEIRVWASAPTESHAPTATEVAAVLSTLGQTSEQPPAKKLRKFMEKVTYAALGGVAVGAALFGSLVATAPDFM